MGPFLGPHRFFAPIEVGENVPIHTRGYVFELVEDSSKIHMEYLLLSSIVQAKHCRCPVNVETLVVVPKQYTSKRRRGAHGLMFHL